jgi:hypothetical protein
MTKYYMRDKLLAGTGGTGEELRLYVDGGLADIYLPTSAALADAVLVDAQTYRGLEGALDMVRRRAKQADAAARAITKSRPDRHGYTALSAEQRQRGNRGGVEWLIAKQTPYGCNTPATEATTIIGADLAEFYGVAPGGGEMYLKYDYQRGVISVSYWTDRPPA